MRSEPFPFAGVHNHHQVVALIVESVRPALLDIRVQPHKFVPRPPVYLSVVFGIELLENLLHRLERFIFGNENDAEGSFSRQADIFGAFAMELRDYRIIRFLQI